MRRVIALCFALMIVAATASKLCAQQSIYMLVDSIKGDQVAPHDREFKLNSFSSAVTSSTTITTGSTGMTAGKASFMPGKVAMRMVPSASGSFYRFVASGIRIPSIEIRFYNATNRIFYKTVFENVIFSSIGTEAADESLQEIEFAYSKVKWFATADAAGTLPLVQIACWDIAANMRC